MLARLVGIALGWLARFVPDAGEERARWRTRWVRSLPAYVDWLHTRHLAPAERRRHLIVFLRDGAAEAFEARFPNAELPEAVRRRLRSPWAALVPSLAVLALGLWWSGGVAPLRRALEPLVPGPAGERLVTADPAHSYFGKSAGYSARQFKVIRERNQSFETTAGYSLRRAAVEKAGAMRTVAFATPELLPLLGLKSGGQVLVAEELGPRRWLGRTIEVQGKTYRVDGVWPRYFRPALARPDFWIVEPAPLFRERHYDTQLVARLRPGITREAASAELRDLVLSAPPRAGSGTPDTVLPLRHRQEGMYRTLGVAWLLATAALVLLAGLRAARRRGAWRRELFFAAKAVPLVTGVAALGVAALDLRWAALAAGTFFVYWWTATLAALGVWLAWRDQETRCPECLTRMTLAVQIGTHGSSLLEGVGDELLCEYGHGALWMPGAPAQAFGPEVWRGN